MKRNASRGLIIEFILRWNLLKKLKPALNLSHSVNPNTKLFNDFNFYPSRKNDITSSCALMCCKNRKQFVNGTHNS